MKTKQPATPVVKSSIKCWAQPPCKWPRCACLVDLVYTTKIHIQRPSKR